MNASGESIPLSGCILGADCIAAWSILAVEEACIDSAVSSACSSAAGDLSDYSSGAACEIDC